MKAAENADLVEQIAQKFSLHNLEAGQFSPLTLAFIGDSVYDFIIRTIVVEQGNAPVNRLHKRCSALVKAPAQMKILHLIENELTEEELAIYKRGRNAKSYTSAKNATISEYRIATGLEALIGYLYLNKQFDRVLELVRLGLERYMDENEFMGPGSGR
ncbi:Mini-ribonuclease 3 [Anaeromicropila populeti]